MYTYLLSVKAKDIILIGLRNSLPTFWLKPNSKFPTDIRAPNMSNIKFKKR